MITSRAPVLSTQNHIINPHAPRAEIIIIFNIRTFSFISGKIWDVYIWNPNHWNIKPMKINEWIYQIKLWKLQHFSIENASFCQFLENFPLFGHIFNFCRIQSILVKNDIFGIFVKLGGFWLFWRFPSNSTDFTHKRLFLHFAIFFAKFGLFLIIYSILVKFVHFRKMEVNFSGQETYS